MRKSRLLLLTSLGLILLTATSAVACIHGWFDPDPIPTKPKTVAPKVVSFPTPDGGLIYADQYGQGNHGVVLAHGARFNKESWENQARVLAQGEIRVLAINFRGYGKSRGGPNAKSRYDGLYFDILGAVRFLRKSGAKTVSVVGASMGGGAAAQASVESKPGEIDRLILIAHSSIEHPERLKSRKLFITSQDDSMGRGVMRLPKIQEQFDQAPQPKELVILDGSAHAQHIFKTEQGDKLLHEIRRFLTKP